MSAMYDRHEVSVKVALYSEDSKQVLLMYHILIIAFQIGYKNRHLIFEAPRFTNIRFIFEVYF